MPVPSFLSFTSALSIDSLSKPSFLPNQEFLNQSVSAVKPFLSKNSPATTKATIPANSNIGIIIGNNGVMIPINKASPARKILLTKPSNPREAIFIDLPNDLSPPPILVIVFLSPPPILVIVFLNPAPKPFIVLLKPSLTESGKNLPIKLAVDLIPDTNKPNVF